MISIRTAAISLMAAFFICSASHAQDVERLPQIPEPQLDSTVTVEPDGSVTVQYFYHPVPVADPWPGVNVIFSGNDTGRQPEDPEPTRLNPSILPGPKDNTAKLGQIPLSSGVTPSGACTYSVPVPVASDCNFPPSVSLEYNSQAGNSEVGYGWSIGGLSAITVRYRIGVFDGYNNNTFYDESGAVYSLDGASLLAIAYPGMTGYTLQTISGQVFVKVHNDNSGRALYFEALFPDGRKATYGSTTSSSPSLVYPMTRVEDLYGNVITYTYADDGGVPVISSIHYGPNTNCAITFSYAYDNAGWPAHSFSMGLNLTRSCRLLSIISSDISGEICTYSLSHETRHAVSLLTRISCSRGFQHLNPIDFEYGNNTGENNQLVALPSWTSYTSYFWSNSFFARGKMIADDYDDGLVTYPLFPSLGDNYPSNQTLLIYPKAGGSYVSITSGNGFMSLTPVDIDGDGRDEVVKAYVDGTVNSETRVRFSVYSFTSETNYYNVTKTVTVPGVIPNGSSSTPAKMYVYYGDFTSCGKVQALIINSWTQYFKIFDLDTQTSVYTGSAFNPGTDYVNAMDMDGDGVSELLRITSSGWATWGYNNATNSFAIQHSGTNVTSQTLTRLVDFGDVNADGNMDIVLRNSNSTKLDYYLFTGRVFYQEVQASSFPTSSSNKSQLIDINNDGYPELVVADGNYVKAYTNNKGQFSSTDYVQANVGGTARIVPVNVYSGGFASAFMAEVVGSGLVRLILEKDRGLIRAATSSSSSYDIVRSHSYTNINRSTLYDLFRSAGDYSSVTGYARQTIPLCVVYEARTSVPMGGGTILRTNYQYYDAVVNRLGLGFCGFGKIWTREMSSEGTLYSETEYDPTDYGVVTESRGSLNQDLSNPYATSQYTYTLSSTYNPFRLPLPSAVTAVDNLTGLTTTETYAFDTTDHPTSTTRTSTAGGTSFVETTTNTYSNSISTTTYISGRVSERMVSRNTAGAPSSSAWMERTVYTYPTGKAVPSNVKTYVGSTSASNLVSETAYTYDAKGNVTSELTAPYGATTFTGSTYTYDSAGRHLTSSTDALGLTTYYSNYNVQGSPGTVTDPLGNQTSYTFDSWGNVTAVAYPDGATESRTWAWDSYGLYTITVSGNAQPTVVTHYNHLERDTQSDITRFNGATQKIKREYTPHGWLKRESLPYNTYSPSQWVVREYDVFGRQLSRTEPTGKTTTWSYSGMTTTRTSEGIWSEQTLGPDGNLASVTDSLGTITYSYRPDGQPSSVTAPGNVVTSFTYDSYGRRTSIIDPSAGTRSTSYTNNSNGSSTVTQTNANGSVTTYIDRYGRVTREERSSSFNTDYTYNSYNQLTSVVSNNGTSKAYTYDSKGRLSTATESVPDSKSLQKSYAYDGSTGRPLSTAYTSQDGLIGTESYTYANGYHTKTILNGTATVWELTSENVLGQPTGATTLSMTRTYSYSTAGLPTGRTAGSVYGESYTFDGAKGNLSDRTRTDQSSGQESFGYDDVNRLITMGTRDVTYDAKGNVTAIDGVGSMSYTDSSHPYRVTGAVLDNGLSTPGTQTVTYTAFDRPASITEGNVSAAFTYNEVSDRVKMAVTDGTNALLTRYYIGGNYEYDIDGNNDVVQRLYLEGDAYSAPVVYIKEGSGSWTPYNIARDYQGSIMAIANSSGTAVATYSYDPWGRLRNPADNTVYTPGNEPSLMLGRGYTGHEHLPWFGLINMNARLYDPLVGRFLSADPYVQTPDFTQAFNRYSYALNNPLKYVDGNGEFALTTGTIIALTAIIGGVSNWYMNGHRFDDKTFGYFAVGAISGVASWYGAGWLAGITQATGVWAGTLIGAATGAASSAATSTITTIGNNLVGGNKWDTGLKSAVGSALASGALLGAISGGIKGYASAKEKGANPWNNRIPGTEETKKTAVKEGIQIQVNDNEYCYAHASAYADAGHGNHTVEDFIIANDGAKGADVSKLKELSGAELVIQDSGGMTSKSLSEAMQVIENPRYELLGTISGGGSLNHWVNIYEINTVNKIHWFGGGRYISVISLGIWNPANGKTSLIPNVSFLKGYMF